MKQLYGGEITDQEKLNKLLFLVIPKDQRIIYERRYEANISSVEKMLRGKFSRKPLRISTTDIDK